MRTTLTNKIVVSGLLVASLFVLTHCSSSPVSEWQKKNQELIEQYNLKVRQLGGVPKAAIASNLEAAKVKSLDNLDSTVLYPGVSAKFFWGSGTMISVLHLAPNAKIPEEILPVDRFLFVLEG